MRSHEPQRIRRVAADLLAATEAMDRDSYLPSSVGNAAVLALGTAITAWIAGFESGARPLVAQCRVWIEDSIARGESFGDPPAYFAMQRKRAQALTNWLLDETDPTELWRETVELHEHAWRQLPDDHREPRFMQEHYLPDYVRDGYDARECARALQVCSGFGAEPPRDSSRIRSELDLALSACRHGDLYEGWMAAGERVLRERLGDWLIQGDGVRAAGWLKLVFWSPNAVGSPGEALARGFMLMERP